MTQVAKSTSTLSKASNSNENSESHYNQLTSRNSHFISSETQQKIRRLQILIAGCGSTGGACIEALARLGVENFSLADNGEYELVNLNRQHARVTDIGKNKAEFHRDEVLAINPFASVSCDRRGICMENVRDLCDRADIVFDAVDVTTPEGMAAKLALHLTCKSLKKPVLSALDVGLLQWGKSFDYREPRLEPLDGKLAAAQGAKHPIRALFEIYPPGLVPGPALQLLVELLEGRASFASQLGCTSDALSAIIVPVILRFVETGELARGWRLDLSQFRKSRVQRSIDELLALPLRMRFMRLLSKTP